jgi:hypothetical protein
MCKTFQRRTDRLVSFPALQPKFQQLWTLSDSAAGFISGIYFGCLCDGGAGGNRPAIPQTVQGHRLGQIGSIRRCQQCKTSDSQDRPPHRQLR